MKIKVVHQLLTGLKRIPGICPSEKHDLPPFEHSWNLNTVPEHWYFDFPLSPNTVHTSAPHLSKTLFDLFETTKKLFLINWFPLRCNRISRVVVGDISRKYIEFDIIPRIPVNEYHYCTYTTFLWMPLHFPLQANWSFK